MCANYTRFMKCKCAVCATGRHMACEGSVQSAALVIAHAACSNTHLTPDELERIEFSLEWLAELVRCTVADRSGPQN